MNQVQALAAFDRHDNAAVGGKAANLGELIRAGFPVPPGFVVTTAAYRDFLEAHDLTEPLRALAEQGPSAAADIRARFTRHPLPDRLRSEVAAAYADLGSPPVAVRSSATAEDLAEASFAGQQDTYLDVMAVEDLLVAVQDCWASLWTERAMAYRAQHEVPATGLALAVVVQQMVPADAAGVLFTANPLNGRADETLISAARGLGEAVVSGTTDSDQLVVDAARRRVLRRQLVAAPVLDDDAVLELADLGARIAAHFGSPQDVEWARAGGETVILQARPITALPPAEAEPPSTWTVPDPTAFYFRASIVEQLPDPLSPLFADLVDGAVTRSLTALMTELIGPGVVRPGDVGLPTVNGYAYYAYSRSGMLRVTLRSAKALVVLGNGRRSSRLRWRTYSRPRYQELVTGWSGQEPAAMSVAELCDGVVALLDAGAEYYTAVQTIIPVAVTSEAAFTTYYRRLVRRVTDPPAVAFLLGFDSMPIRAEKALYDLAGWVRSQPELAEAMQRTTTTQFLAESETAIGAPWPEFFARLQAHLDRFGHTVYNLDFVNPVPADDPGPLVDTLRYYLLEESTDPYQRQQRSAAAREQATASVTARLGPVRRSAFLRLLRWAQEAAPIREDALADVGLAWPLLRRMLAELGRRLVAAGVVEAVEDVYWLRWAELTDALGFEPPAWEDVASLRQAVEQRRALWRGQRRVTPPQLLPERAWMKVFSRVMPAATREQNGAVLSGVGASAGRVTAVARVVDGPEQLGEFHAGEILVAPITTPAWTSLFGRAAGIVTDVGGPLSHSSIVAREYGIPAVLGTSVATRRIRSGQRITVDGDAGTVTLHDQDEPGGQDDPASSGQRGPGG